MSNDLDAIVKAIPSLPNLIKENSMGKRDNDGEAFSLTNVNHTGMQEQAFATKKDTGLRYNEGKPKWSLVNFAAMEPMIRVLEYGAKKYSPRNWMKGLSKSEILDSMQRHLAALIDGEEIDPESGMPHIGHIGCNYMFYSYFTQVNPTNARD